MIHDDQPTIDALRKANAALLEENERLKADLLALRIECDERQAENRRVLADAYLARFKNDNTLSVRAADSTASTNPTE